MDKQLLVTGSSGIAEAVIEKATRNGIQVTFIGVDEEQVNGLASRTGAFGVVCDLRDEAAVEAAFQGFNAVTDVIHVAGGSGRSFGMDASRMFPWMHGIRQLIST